MKNIDTVENRQSCTSCVVFDENEQKRKTIELRISYVCVLVGYSPNLSFLPQDVQMNLALNTTRSLNSKDNPVGVDEFTHESIRFKRLFAMGPLIGDNFVRFGIGGALAICSEINKRRKDFKKTKSEENDDDEILFSSSIKK